MQNTLHEKLLLYRIRSSHDADAFAKLYDAYIQRIYRFVYFKVQVPEEAQDITSETFLRLWQYLSSGKQVTHLGALLYEIARNTIIDHHRKQKGAETPEEDVLAQIPDIQALNNIQRSAEIGQILTAVRLLKDEYREVLIMRYIDGSSTSEIAALLKKSPGAIRVLLHRSLETVRTLLTPSEK